MIRRLRAFASDRRGLAALEFALIAPLLVAILMLGADGWLRASQLSDMRTAMQTGVRYYQAGGADDTVAQSVSTAAWGHRPSGGTLNVARVCSCTAGGSAVDCATVCPGSATPMTFITLSASGTFTGLMGTRSLSANDVVRVR